MMRPHCDKQSNVGIKMSKLLEPETSPDIRTIVHDVQQVEIHFCKMDDEAFYNAFRAEATGPPSGISAKTFEDIIRKDKAKADFIKKWTNIFNEESSASPPVIMRDKPQKPDSSDDDTRMHVLYSDLPRDWHRKVKSYVQKHWDCHGCFASIYPILLELERGIGPGWRLDRIPNGNAVRIEACPNSTLNFHFDEEPYIYSIWREKVRVY
ncbi:unnamed protein product [Echinostoma caproni]|uniref:JmjC domain-containing protein n=1 Tax=Echinostoma caproni TaxID=27848 RepID=A0A183ADH0_9TREM|nr:unnamed protein product [Echinostoma caproni]